MLNYSLGIIDAMGFILAVLSFMLASVLVIRTEKELDVAAKFLLGCSVVVLIGNLTAANGYLGGVVPEGLSNVIFHSSRFFSLIFFNLALYFLVKLTKKK